MSLPKLASFDSDCPDLDPFWIKKGLLECQGIENEVEFHQAVIEYANQWRIDKLLETLGWVHRGSSELSSSRYYTKDVPSAAEPDADSSTFEVRVSDHEDHYETSPGVEHRFQINFRKAEVCTWSDVDIPPQMSNQDALTHLEDLEKSLANKCSLANNISDLCP